MKHGHTIAYVHFSKIPRVHIDKRMVIPKFEPSPSRYLVVVCLFLFVLHWLVVCSFGCLFCSALM